MYIRHRIEIYIPVDSRKAVEILIFTPASGSPLEHLCSQLVFSLFYIVGQLKFRWRKCIFTVAHKFSVKPDCNPALCALERDEETFTLHSLRYSEIFHIACRRIKVLRNLSRPDIFASFPRVLCIRILRCIISLHLYMRRHADIIPVRTAVFLFLKPRDCRLIILRIMEFPYSIQTFRKHRRSFHHVCRRCVVRMIGMGVFSSVPEILRILHLHIIKRSHILLPPLNWYLYYTVNRQTCV